MDYEGYQAIQIYTFFLFRERFTAEWGKADEVEFLSIEDYFKTLENKAYENIGEEFLIRLDIWMSYNDRIREGKEIFVDEDYELKWAENCYKLIELALPFVPENKLMIAELNRNLGKFEECIYHLLNEIITQDLLWIKEKLITECYCENRWVIELN
ncbi:MAG TPA: hypothetical protein GXX67_11530 [Petrimonas sp.]|jgi:hypothetical protein|nr:hypothetical protein [Petrimonas sp.]